ncbi:MAG: twin-arginine translocase TatA/TatE family subunit [Opitutales bacterium]|nr:twin-arginine translocase TatA/TatE family subunit [Opitutales bacterium]
MINDMLLHFSFIQGLGGPELIIIFFVILLLFGAKRLPELFRSFGKSIGEFKKATRDIETDFRQAMDTTEEPAPRTPPVTPKAEPTAPAPKAHPTSPSKEG